MPKMPVIIYQGSMYATDIQLFYIINQQRLKSYLTSLLNFNSIFKINCQTAKKLDIEKEKELIEKAKAKYGLNTK